MDFRVLWLLIPITSLTSGFYRVEAFLGGEKPDRNVPSVYFTGGGVPLYQFLLMEATGRKGSMEQWRSWSGSCSQGAYLLVGEDSPSGQE